MESFTSVLNGLTDPMMCRKDLRGSMVGFCYPEKVPYFSKTRDSLVPEPGMVSKVY